jgi:hypothetical protein
MNPIFQTAQTVFYTFTYKLKHSLYRLITGPEASRRLGLPDFETVGT